MGKFLNEDYESVEAFSKEEMEAEIKKQTAKFEADLKAKDKEIEDAKAIALEKDEKLTKRSEEYKNLKKALDEKEATLGSIESDRKATFEKMRDDMIKKASGEDKEYAEMLKTQFERVGKETLNPTELESALKDAHALTLTQMNREYTAFSMSDGASGQPPVINDTNAPKPFTETEEGKNVLLDVKRAMGQTSAAQVNSTDPNAPVVIY